ncbi:MAG: hypothetical protein ACP5OA_01335 [Candidatus Woesearchaeota archaeon]
MVSNVVSNDVYLDFVSRINNVTKLCNVQYTNNTIAWTHTFGFIDNLVKDKDIFEIGYGFFGGLAKFVLENGAKSYVGVDIDPLAVKLSKELMPEINFLWEDPVYVLNNLDKFDLNGVDKNIACISSGVMDTSILKCPYYITSLIEAIRMATPIDGYSIHSGNMIRKDFNKYFEKAGFSPLNVDSADCFEVYKRVK